MNRDLLRRPVAAVAALVGLVLLAYAPALSAGWLWDDDILVTRNPLVTEPTGLWGIWFDNTTPDYFPATLTTYWLEYRLWGDWAPGYHTVNVVLHAVDAVLLWRILVRLGVPGAWLAAALWGVHPVTVSSVAWVAERKNTLSLLFGCLSLLAWFDFEDRGGGRRYLASLAAFVAALLAKTSLVTLPLMFPLMAWWRRGRIGRDDLVRTIPFLTASFLLGMVTLWYQMEQPGRGTAGPVAKLLEALPRGGVLAGKAIGFYLGKDLWPTRLAMVYPNWKIDPRDPAAWVPSLAVAAAFALLWRSRARSSARAVLFAAAVFVFALLPILGFLPAVFMVAYSCVADHWQYVALAAPVALAVAAVWRLVPAGPGRGIVAAAAIAACGVATFRQARHYRSSESLWRYNLTVSDSWIGHGKLAETLAAEGRDAEAIASAKAAVRAYPAAEPIWRVLGAAAMRQERYAEAHAALLEAWRLSAEDGLLHDAAVAAAKAGDLVRAERLLARAAEGRPNVAEIRMDWGRALLELGRRADAEARYREALACETDSTGAMNALAWILATRPEVSEGRSAGEAAAEAVALARRASTLTGDADPAILDTLAVALAAAGDYPGAVATADRALAIAGEAGEAELVREIRRHRDRFAAGRPFIDE